MDMKIGIACMLIAGGAIGFVMPAADHAASLAEAAPAATSDAPPQLAVVQDPAYPAWGEDVVLQRARDGHFYADVQVDGRSYLMLVDTGASVVALTAEDALDMGYEWFEDDVSVVGQGASGPVLGVDTTIDRVTLGGHEATGVRAIIITEGAGISLLGQSFLSTIGKVEISGDRMTLGG